GKFVALHHDFALVADQDGFGGSGPAVDAHEGLNVLARLEGVGHKLMAFVAVLELGQLVFGLVQSEAATLLLLFQAADVDVPLEFFLALVNADLRILVHGKTHAAEGGKILGVVGNFDQIFGVNAFRQGEVALLPNPRDVEFPAILHALDVSVRPAEQQHGGTQSVAARQHRQILLNNRLKQRGHQLAGGYAALLQSIDVRLREYAALPCHRV